MSGLSREHHGELNHVGVPEGRFDELRRQYKDNPLALEQLDVYDPTTEYHTHLHRYVDAMKGQEQLAIEEEERWLNINYPLLTALVVVVFAVMVFVFSFFG